MTIFDNFKNLGSVRSDSEEYQHPTFEVDESRDVLEESPTKRSFLLFFTICFFIALFLIIRLVDLQIAQGAKNRYLAEGNRIRIREIVAPRGIFLDRNDVPLVRNIATASLEIYPYDLPKDPSSRQEFIDKIAQLANLKAEDFERINQKGINLFEPIVLKEDIPRDEALLLESRISSLPGVYINKRPTRQYLTTPGLSHILGYVGKVSPEELEKKPDYQMTSLIGKSGLEKIYESELRGQSGQEKIEVDSMGKPQRILNHKDFQVGNSIQLYLDKGLQEEMAKSLQVALDEFQSKAGVAIAADPQTGGILGMVSLPNFDNNIFSHYLEPAEYQDLLKNPGQPLLNRAIQALYPSGSTIKPVMASAGLQEGVINEKTTIVDPGEIRIGEWVFPDWKNHGLVDVKKAIAESCNIFFYAIGGGWENIKGLGIERIQNYLDKFGFGKSTGIDLPGEVEGFVPSPQWKKEKMKESWYLGDTYHVSIGQGDFLTTPLQLLNAEMAIANGGELLRPRMVAKIINPKGEIVKEFAKEVVSQGFIDKDKIEIVRQGMRQTVTEGSGRSLNDLSVEVAGKTGTAQFGSEGKTHAWFVGFAPYDNPQIAVLVLVEGGGEGHAAAAPVAKDIFKYFFEHTPSGQAKN